MENLTKEFSAFVSVVRNGLELRREQLRVDAAARGEEWQTVLDDVAAFTSKLDELRAEAGVQLGAA